ncbi:MAG: LysM peptidoglycan-binding domain-containing protein [Chloroflexi bacterium]|nr:LysM peptidoglycan-binding domain-containing protein [Chloroflexota bacterium]
MRRKILVFTIVLLTLTLPFITPLQRAQASSLSAADIIAMVNNIRIASYGLPALIEDSILDSTASWTAQVMAETGQCVHLANQGYPGASNRIMSAGYGGGKTIFATENMACGSNVTISWLESAWSDSTHMLPMVEKQYVRVGAGVYTSASGMTYFVLHAATDPGGASGVSSSSIANTPSSTNLTSEWINPILTSTPDEDGSVYHVVASGQALSTIAEFYGVTVDVIKLLNPKLTSNDIFPGDVLLIRLAPTATLTPTRTPTVVMATRTLTQTMAPSTPAPTHTLTPTPDPAISKSKITIDRQWLGLGLLVVCALGFFIVFFFLFLKPLRKK